MIADPRYLCDRFLLKNETCFILLSTMHFNSTASYPICLEDKIKQFSVPN